MRCGDCLPIHTHQFLLLRHIVLQLHRVASARPIERIPGPNTRLCQQLRDHRLLRAVGRHCTCLSPIVHQRDLSQAHRPAALRVRF